MTEYLQSIHGHPRDAQITFEEEGHAYTIDGSSDFTSVTTWIHSPFPHFDADKIINSMMASPKWPKSKYFGMTKEAIKKQWSDSGKQASTAGTKLHYDIECFYNQTPVTNDSIEYKYFEKFQKDIGRHLKPYRTEWMVYHKDLKFAGSIDMIFENEDGTLQIYDWKRSKGIKKSNMFECAKPECISHLPNSNFWHYSLQLNTYKAILEANYGKRITDMFLICLHPNHSSYQRIRVPHLPEEMADLFALRAEKLCAIKG